MAGPFSRLVASEDWLCPNLDCGVTYPVFVNLREEGDECCPECGTPGVAISEQMKALEQPGGG